MVEVLDVDDNSNYGNTDKKLSLFEKYHNVKPFFFFSDPLVSPSFRRIVREFKTSTSCKKKRDPDPFTSYKVSFSGLLPLIWSPWVWLQDRVTPGQSWFRDPHLSEGMKSF